MRSEGNACAYAIVLRLQFCLCHGDSERTYKHTHCGHNVGLSHHRMACSIPSHPRNTEKTNKLRLIEMNSGLFRCVLPFKWLFLERVTNKLIKLAFFSYALAWLLARTSAITPMPIHPSILLTYLPFRNEYRDSYQPACGDDNHHSLLLALDSLSLIRFCKRVAVCADATLSEIS